jgi:hypothetical protein
MSKGAPDIFSPDSLFSACFLFWKVEYYVNRYLLVSTVAESGIFHSQGGCGDQVRCKQPASAFNFIEVSQSINPSTIYEHRIATNAMRSAP